jgi:formylglycine-generating enzyme required for sulfatase activity
MSRCDYAWFTGNASSTTHAAGTKKPNPWGLHDMHGNVLEWCLDNWTGSLPGGTITNLPAPATGSLRVARGGSWLYEGRFSRSANRDDYSPSNRCSDLGFRVVLAPSEQ